MKNIRGSLVKAAQPKLHPTRLAPRAKRRINQVRIVVEHIMGHLKIFQVLVQTYRHPRNSHDEVFEIVAALANHRIRKRLHYAALA